MNKLWQKPGKWLRAFISSFGASSSDDPLSSVFNLPKPSERMPGDLESATQLMDGIRKDGEVFQQSGRALGKRGIDCRHVKDLARICAQEWYEMIAGKVTPRLEKLKTNLANIRKELTQFEAKCYEAEKNLDDLRLLQKWDHKIFKETEGKVYIGIAIVLIATDLPLAYKTLLPFGFSGRLSEFGFDFILEFTWSMLFMVGLALLPFYFKYYHDKYLLRNQEKLVAQFEIREIPGKYEGVQVSEKLLRKLRKVWWTRFSIDSLLLLFLILLIAALAYVRIDTEKLFPATPDHPHLRQMAIGVLLLLGILLPLVGGILLSVGLYKLQMFRSLEDARHNTGRVQQEFKECQARELHLIEQQEQQSQILRWLESDTFVETYLEYFYNSFLDGYKVGLDELPSKDLYEWAKFLRERELKLSGTSLKDDLL